VHLNSDLIRRLVFGRSGILREMVLFLRIVCEFLAQFDGCFEVFCLFGHFLLAIVILRILRITAFDYSFGMFKVFFIKYKTDIIYQFIKKKVDLQLTE